MKNKNNNRVSAPNSPAGTVRTRNSRHVHVSLSHLFCFSCVQKQDIFPLLMFASVCNYVLCQIRDDVTPASCTEASKVRYQKIKK